ncbi:MAG: outer membrane lipoprotein-sorting protein [Kangiellaceae bacterium]|nr:outer membrane lipoprotein-sorting protein [Kangiellaceae bacterium]
MQTTKVIIRFFILCPVIFLPGYAASSDASKIIKAAMDQWRGITSHSTMSMTIHRPDWERTMTMEGWTEGEKKSLIRVLEPKKDAGNGTLLLDNKIWTFSPKVNRVIKIPSSLMNQSWMGSDFSNKDVARSADIIDQYVHTLIKTETNSEGFKVYEIESVTKEDAPVVWGKEILRIRDDYVMLEHTFYDQDMQAVKRMLTLKIGMMGGRMVALQQRMAKIETPDEYTEIQVLSAEFDIEIPQTVFTLSNLRNPRF